MSVRPSAFSAPRKEPMTVAVALRNIAADQPSRQTTSRCRYHASNATPDATSRTRTLTTSRIEASKAIQRFMASQAAETNRRHLHRYFPHGPDVLETDPGGPLDAEFHAAQIVHR